MSLQIHNWNGLQQFGINALTGEACKYSMRLLCDLNEDGVELLRDFFGLQIVLNPKTQFAENWNSQVNGKPALVSIMLPRGVFDDLCRFALQSKGTIFAVRTPAGDWIGYTSEDVVHYTLTSEKLQITPEWRVYYNPPQPGSGSRNQHAFTGRTT